MKKSGSGFSRGGFFFSINLFPLSTGRGKNKKRYKIVNEGWGDLQQQQQQQQQQGKSGKEKLFSLSLSLLRTGA